MYEKENKRVSHLIILLSYTLFTVALLLEGILLRWDIRVILELLVGLIVCWALHITDKAPDSVERWLYFALAMM